MRLIRTRIENFKLLESIAIDFSTDPQRPLTVIRAENGAGKTSFMYALAWAFYGMRGLPEAARGLRLTSSFVPAGTPTDVEVMVEFEHTDESGTTARYRLVRSVVETPTEGDQVTRENERVRLLRITAAGEEDIHAASDTIGKFIPIRLLDIFFTNGDDTQTFISGRVSSAQRQGKVHEAIKMLLGLDVLRTAAEDLDAVCRRLRAKAAKAGGADTSQLEEALERTDADLAENTRLSDACTEKLGNMTAQHSDWEKELKGLRGIGELDDLNAQIEQAEKDKDGFEAQRASSLTRMRAVLRGEACSWALLRERFDAGLMQLANLAQLDVIPGTSLRVLEDRLELEKCICGAPLTPNSEAAAHIHGLIEAQRQATESSQQLTELFYQARQLKAGEEAREASNDDFIASRADLLREFSDARGRLADKGELIKKLKEQREHIDEDKVRDLTAKLSSVVSKINDKNNELGQLKARRETLDDRRAEQERRLREAMKAGQIGRDLLTKRDVARDLLSIAQGTLRELEGDYVHRVSDRMNDLFMEIVGANPEFEAAVFKRVRIDEHKNITVDTHDGRTLDPDFELNGASQRALTLAFIWALMEVSGTPAPRIIDTPLGMVAGGVKTRMMDVITHPAGSGMPDFQVVLLLTRSELRDVEDIIDRRAGKIFTLSNSKDYPEDLVYSWGTDHAVSRVCGCDHRHSCRICARRYDAQHGLEFVDEAVPV